MARKHDDLRRRFIKLEAKMLSNEHPDHETALGWCAERLDIESDEPPAYIALDLLCEIEQAIATDTKRDVRLTRWQRITAHWTRWENLSGMLMEQPTP